LVGSMGSNSRQHYKRLRKEDDDEWMYRGGG